MLYSNCKRCNVRLFLVRSLGRRKEFCDECRRTKKRESERLRRKSNPPAKRPKKEPLQLCCHECGSIFLAKKITQKFCSRRCGNRAWAKNGTCIECGSRCWKNSTRCDSCCRKTHTPLVATITCLHCKKAAKKRCWQSKLPKYCSRECFFAHIDACHPESERAKKREYAATRGSGSYRSRCKRYGGYFNSKVTRRAVFERDRFKCYLCRVKVSEELPARHDRKATLDHVVPLEKKGPHDWHNVACCCRKCNVAKRNNWDGRQVLDFSGGWESVNG